jgi:hypothetical protein
MMSLSIAGLRFERESVRLWATDKLLFQENGFYRR